MSWPSAQVKTNFDAGTDDPKQARSEIAGNVDKFNEFRSHVSSYIQGLLDDADAAAARTTLSAQPLDATLTSLAAVAGVAGDILYASGTDVWARLAKGSDGQALALASGIPAWGSPITRKTAIPTTSGTAHGFTGIRAGANLILLMLSRVSLDADDDLLIQIGDSGGYETADYVSGSSIGLTGDGGNTTGFQITAAPSSGLLYSGAALIMRINGNQWVSFGVISRSIDGTGVDVSSGRGPTAMSELDRIQITRSASASFDNGEINIFVM